MRLLVVGDGKVGHMLAEQLASENHDVVIVDKSDAALRKSQNTLDVMTLQGNGANAKTLLEAEVGKADILIAATAGDETNMLCSLIGKRLGAKYTIARIRDPEFHESLSILQTELDIDMAVNPERATALEISRLIRLPPAINIESFAHDRVEMVQFRVRQTDPIVGQPLHMLTPNAKTPILYAAIERESDVIIPNGDTVIHVDDKLYVTGEHSSMTAYFKYLGRESVRIKNILIMGGGRIAYYLAKALEPLGVSISIIEIDPKKAVELSVQLPEVNIILGDASDRELLDQEGLDTADAFIALGDRDEENLLAGLHASAAGVEKVIVKNNRVTDPAVISRLGLDSIVSPKAIVCDAILRYVRAHEAGIGTAVEKVYRLLDDKAEALEFIANPGEKYIGIPLKRLAIRGPALIVCIVRSGHIIIPFGDDYIEAGDNVIVVTARHGISDLNEVLRA
jgi:trk system potassium uptake protein TrkA